MRLMVLSAVLLLGWLAQPAMVRAETQDPRDTGNPASSADVLVETPEGFEAIPDGVADAAAEAAETKPNIDVFNLEKYTVEEIAEHSPEVFKKVEDFLSAGAEKNTIAAVLCQVVNWFLGPVGRGIATLAIIVLGIGALMGKVSYGMALTTGVGIATIFGAEKIVLELTGEAITTCAFYGYVDYALIEGLL